MSADRNATDGHRYDKAIDRDVGCPACGYNLRGLGDSAVTCPECGLVSDVAILVVRRWDRPWYRAPRYSVICLPAAVALLTVLGFMLIQGVLEAGAGGSSAGLAAGTVWLAAGLVLWCLAMAWIWRTMDGLPSAGFALLVHGPILGYLASLVLFCSGLVTLIMPLMDGGSRGGQGNIRTILIGIVLLLLGIGLFVLSRWIERLVAGHCIRLYLRQTMPRE